MTSVISDDGDVAAEISDLVAAGLQLAVAQAREELDDDLAVQVFSLLTPGVILARAIDLELPSMMPAMIGAAWSDKSCVKKVSASDSSAAQR